MNGASRCSFSESILICYGSFEGCCDQRIPGLLDNDIGMIVADELSFREWKCFEHLTRQRVGSHLSWPPKRASVWSSSGSRQREEFRTLCTSCMMVSLDNAWPGDGEVRKPRQIGCLKLTAPRENVGGSIQRYFVGLFGICSGDACSWDQQSLLPPFCT